MDKKLRFEEAKGDMRQILENMTLETFTEHKDKLQKYLAYTELLVTLPDIQIDSVENNIVAIPTTSSECTNSQESDTEPTFQELLAQEESQPQTPQKETLYTFERKLKGGYLPDLDGGYPIPEFMVHDLDIEHMDKLRITASFPYKGEMRYLFEIAEHGPKIPLPERVEIPFCIVETKYNEFVVRRSAAGDIIIDGEPAELFISDYDARKLGDLEKDDIIDIAYYANDPESVRGIWKWAIDERDLKKNPAPSKKKKKGAAEAPKREFPVDKRLFEGKRIVVVGNEDRASDYREAFESLNVAELTHFTSDESETAIASAIRLADLVVVTHGQGGHKGMFFAKDASKAYKVPVVYTSQFGAQAVLVETQEKLKQIMK